MCMHSTFAAQALPSQLEGNWLHVAKTDADVDLMPYELINFKQDNSIQYTGIIGNPKPEGQNNNINLMTACLVKDRGLISVQSVTGDTIQVALDKLESTTLLQPLPGSTPSECKELIAMSEDLDRLSSNPVFTIKIISDSSIEIDGVVFTKLNKQLE